MTLMSFLLACHTLMLEQQERFHVETPAVAPEPTPEQLRQQNADSMKQLGMMMSGVQRAPKVGR